TVSQLVMAKRCCHVVYVVLIVVAVSTRTISVAMRCLRVYLLTSVQLGCLALGHRALRLARYLRQPVILLRSAQLPYALGQFGLAGLELHRAILCCKQHEPNAVLLRLPVRSAPSQDPKWSRTTGLSRWQHVYRLQ